MADMVSTPTVMGPTLASARWLASWSAVTPCSDGNMWCDAAAACACAAACSAASVAADADAATANMDAGCWPVAADKKWPWCAARWPA